jgi:hypothetical protein
MGVVLGGAAGHDKELMGVMEDGRPRAGWVHGLLLGPQDMLYIQRCAWRRVDIERAAVEGLLG